MHPGGALCNAGGPTPPDDRQLRISRWKRGFGTSGLNVGSNLRTAGV